MISTQRISEKIRMNNKNNKPSADGVIRTIKEKELIVYAGSYPTVWRTSNPSARVGGYYKIGLADSIGPIIEVRSRILTSFELKLLPEKIANYLRMREENPKYSCINGVFVEKNRLIEAGKIDECQFQMIVKGLEEILKKGVQHAG